jgi:hypothetical protein
MAQGGAHDKRRNDDRDLRDGGAILKHVLF